MNATVSDGSLAPCQTFIWTVIGIVVTGSPARTQRQSLYIRRLDRPADGFNYQQIGNRPSIGPRTSRPRN